MSQRTYSPIVELRMYSLHPGRRDELIELFEREFIETQEAVGIQVLGQFHDLDDPDQFVWLRGFNDMSAREKSLDAFYSGPVWKAHREAANATMIDSDNVLLLRPVHPGAGFSFSNGSRPPRSSRAGREGFVSATIYYFDRPATPEFTHYFESKMQPEIANAGGSILAYLVTEDSPNTYPRLPVREGEHAFVWFAGFPNQQAYRTYLASLRQSQLWNEAITASLKEYLQGKPEVLRLAPTSRSWLTGRV